MDVAALWLFELTQKYFTGTEAKCVVTFNLFTFILALILPIKRQKSHLGPLMRSCERMKRINMPHGSSKNYCCVHAFLSQMYSFLLFPFSHVHYNVIQRT